MLQPIKKIILLFLSLLVFAGISAVYFFQETPLEAEDQEDSSEPTAIVYPEIDISMQGLLDNNRWSELEAVRRQLTQGKLDAKVRKRIESLMGQPIPQSKRNDPDALMAWLIQMPADKDILYDYLKFQIPYQVDQAIDSTNDPGRRNLRFAWMWHELAIAAMNGYEATGETRFLNLVAESFDVILQYRDDRLGIVDGFLGKPVTSWGHQRPEDTLWWNEVTIPGRIAQPAAMFCHAVYQNDTLSMAYRIKADYFKKELRDVILGCAEMYEVDAGKGYYVNHQLKRPDAINHINAFAAFLSIYQTLGRDADMSCRLEELEQGFRQHFCELDNGSLTWPYFYQSTTDESCELKPEYSWKAQVSMYFPVFAHKYGTGFSQEEVKQCAQTFKENIYRGDRFNSIIGSNYVDYADAYDPQPYSITGFAILSEFDPEVFSIIEHTVAHRQDLIEYGWFSNRMTAMAYSYKLLIGQ
ncbi:hypothetical protein KFE98_00395 [bacterium SCSIO 12741]|nr:hypothetical protein KFE98_00395 [bacterium SCSIO 12741]